MVSSWRRYGWTVRERDGWLIGTTSRLYALYGALFLPIAAACALARSARPDPAQTAFHVVGGIAAVACALMLVSTNEVRIDLATGAVQTRRGLFCLARRHDFVRPQIDGVFMTIHEDGRHPNQHFCAVGLQAGLGRWAMLRTMDGERAVAFYRDLKEATGFPGISGF